jgi:spoIIIJ-associated protein
MDTEESLKEILEKILKMMEVEYSRITVNEEEKNTFSINIESENPSLLIGYHGDNIQALQHLVKTLMWKQNGNEQFNIILDIDDYRKRQEESVLEMAKRKVDILRKNKRPQKLPPMSPYFRRKIHMMCMSPGFDDIETISDGRGDQRFITLHLKS